MPRSRVVWLVIRLVGIFDAVIGLMWILFCYPYLVAQMTVGAVLVPSGFLLLWLAENQVAIE